MASRGQWHFTFPIQCHSLKKWTPSITKHELSGVESTWGILFKVCHANLHKNFSSPFLIAFFLFFMGGVGKPIAASAPGSMCEHLSVGKLHRGFLHSSTQGLFASCWMEPLSSQCKGQGRMMRCTVWPSSMKAESQLTWGPQISNSPWVNLRGGFYNEKGWDRGRRRKEKNRITSGNVISVATNGSFPLVFFFFAFIPLPPGSAVLHALITMLALGWWQQCIRARHGVQPHSSAHCCTRQGDFDHTQPQSWTKYFYWI